MINYLGSKTGAYLWEIDDVQLTLGFNKQVERAQYHRCIRDFKKILLAREYQTNSATLKRLFNYFGCIPFFRIGMEAFCDQFLDMCRHYAREYIKEEYHKKSSAFKRIPSFGCVLAFITRCDQKAGLDSFAMLSTYEKEYRIIMSQLMHDEFAAFCGEKITAALSAGLDLYEIAGKIGVVRVTGYCMDFAPELTEYVLRGIISRFTERRLVISLFGVQKALWGKRKEHGYVKHICDQRFTSLIETMVQNEIILQKDRFIKENYLEIDVGKDIWKIYRMHGGNLSLCRVDFTVIESPSLRLEVKHCIIHRINQNSYINFVSCVSHALNILSRRNPSIKYISDITKADARALYMYMETEYITPHGNKLSVTTIGNIFSYCSYLCEYHMSDRRSSAIRSPRPYHNPFSNFKFVNLEDYKKNTDIIPESVIEQIDRHIWELNKAYQLFYRIFSNTGMRMKEVLFLRAECIESSRYNNLSEIKYTPYKVLSARRKAGLEDNHRILIQTQLADEILEYAQTTQEYRDKSGLQYIFMNAKYHGKINMISMGAFLKAINKLIEKYGIRGDNGELWHFTTRQSRKTIAVTLIENGASTAELAYWLGHLTSSTSMRYYAEVRKMKLAQLNTAFFKKQFDLLLSKQQLASFTQEERKLLYIDFQLEQRRVEFGFCLRRPADGDCVFRNSMYNCMNCQHLCTGIKYLVYWQQLLEEQTAYLNELLRSYKIADITSYTEFKEYQRAKFMTESNQNIVDAIKNGGKNI